jgi:hypothetical protein
MGVISHLREIMIKPPSYDPRNIMDLLDKYRDAQISDSGWREVDRTLRNGMLKLEISVFSN